MTADKIESVTAHEVINKIINAPLAELYTFKDHPFRVEDDEKMEETTESSQIFQKSTKKIATKNLQ